MSSSAVARRALAVLLVLAVAPAAPATPPEPTDARTEAPAAIDADAAAPVARREDVVVTASRGEREARDVAASVSVVGADEMAARAYRYAGDELSSTPGVVVRRTHEGAFTSVSVRGIPNTHLNDTVLALVDGVPFVTRNDEVDLDQVPYDALERVEVVKGPMSALYGRGAVAGVLNYVTRTPSGQRAGRLTLDGGQHGYLRPSATFESGLGAHQRVLLAGTYERKDGWRERTGRDVRRLFAKHQWTPDARTALTLAAHWQRFEQELASHLPVDVEGRPLPLPGGSRANFQIDGAREERHVWAGSLRFDRDLGGGFALQASAHVRRARTRSYLGFDAGFDAPRQAFLWNGFDGRSRQSTAFVEPQLTWRSARARVVAGASWEDLDSRDSEDWTGEFGLTPDFNFYFYTQERALDGTFLNRERWTRERLLDARSDGRVTGVYAQAEMDVSPRLLLTVGARRDAFRRGVDYRELAVAPAARQDARDDHLSPKASLVWRATPAVNLYAAFGEGFNPAFGPVFAFGARRPDLRPEIARSFEVGSKGSLFGARFGYTAAAWRIDRRDLLQLVFDEGRWRTANAGGQRAQGFEFEGRARLRGFDAYARYALTSSRWRRNMVVLEFTGESFDLSGLGVAGQPRHMAALGATRRFANGVALDAWCELNGDYFIDGENTLRGGSFALLNARLAFTPRALPRVSAQVVATNLLDRRYDYLLGSVNAPLQASPGLPREISASLRLDF